MAYMSFSEWPGAPLTTRASAADVPLFSPVELRVISLAQRVDAVRERDSDGRFARFLNWAFGIPIARPLADPRLEALRRFASKARHHAATVDHTDIRMLVASGYTMGQAYGLAGYAGRQAGVRAAA